MRGIKSVSRFIFLIHMMPIYSNLLLFRKKKIILSGMDIILFRKGLL